MSYEDFIARLPKSVQKSTQTVSEVKTVKYETASIGLNWATSGGLGAGRLSILYGNSGSGKSLLTLQSIAKWQEQGLTCAYLDAEGTVTSEFAEKLGVDTSKLIYISKRGFGQAVDGMMPYIENGVDIAVVDTYSDLIPDQFVNTDGTIKDFDDAKQLGAHAKSTTRMINMFMYSLPENTALLMLSQTTTKIENTWTQQIPHGGVKAEFAASTMIKLTSSRSDAAQHKGEVVVGDSIMQMPIGREVKATVVKNKFGPEMRTAKWDIYYAGEKLGIDFNMEVVDLAIKYGLISGTTWLSWHDVQKQGRKNMAAYFAENLTAQEQLRKELEGAMYGLQQV